MSGENVELVRQVYEAFNREGSKGTLPFLDPDVEWDESRVPARRGGAIAVTKGS
jgi:ketosteroid isomerase-like protein